MFDDRIVVESPGSLPGIVRLNNMRQVHFSRNPKIAAFLHEYEYVQEFGEGIDRIYKEMEKAGLPAPEYKAVAFMLNATIWNKLGTTSDANDMISDANGTISDANDTDNNIQISLSENESIVYHLIQANPEASTQMIADSTSLSIRTVQRCIVSLREKKMINSSGTRKHIRWIILN